MGFYEIILITIVVAVPAAVVVSIAVLRIRRTRTRGRLIGRRLSPRDDRTIRRNVPLYRCLPQQLQEQLQGLVQVFLAEKLFIGCGGLEVTDKMRLVIAAQACMLLLNRDTRYYPRLKTIYIYPDAFAVRQDSDDGFLHVEGPDVRVGESWDNGPVVLAWQDVRDDAHTRDGSNVVLHEFAHQLDQENGEMDGTPLLPDKARCESWARVFTAEYEALQRRKGGPTVLDRYGAESPAEFFAVATEAFFEKPAELKSRHGELYAELAAYYNLDPAAWAGQGNIRQ